MGLQIATRESSDVTILDFRGRLTVNGGGSELLSWHLKELVANGVRKLLLNLADITQIDNSGVSMIVRTLASLTIRGGDLRLVRPGGNVQEASRVLYLVDIIPSFEEETQALVSFRLLGSFANHRRPLHGCGRTAKCRGLLWNMPHATVRKRLH